MSGRLSSFVHVSSPEGEPKVFGPDSELPDWAASVIDNPKAWEGGVHPGVPDPAPAKPESEAPAGNASRDDWADYARSQGAEEGDLADKDGKPLGRDELREKYGKSE